MKLTQLNFVRLLFMKQVQFIHKLAAEGLKEHEIEIKLHEQFGNEAFKKTAIYKHMDLEHLGFKEDEKEPRTQNRVDTQLLNSIQQALFKEPYSTIRSIADKLKVSVTTTWRYVHIHLGYVYKHTRWVPHILNDEQKKIRVEESKKLLNILRLTQRRGWRDIITGDQSWFTLSYGINGCWLHPEEEAPEFDSGNISVKKVMLTVIWGVNGIYILDFKPEEAKYNSTYFIDNILIPLSEMKSKILLNYKANKIWLHLDNCKVHNAKITFAKYEVLGFKRTPHPPYSPDIAPSDFFLFGYVKEKLKGHVFNDINDLKEKIVEIIMSISAEKRKEVFENWIKRCERVIELEGSYFKED